MGGVNLKYRLKYIKTDNLVFISHLDILKVIQRAFRRANVDLEHSKGFNPHPKVHFAPPLPLFTSSMGEYMDVETKEDFKPEELLKRLNKVLPKNLCLIDAKKLEDGAESLWIVPYIGLHSTICIVRMFLFLQKEFKTL